MSLRSSASCTNEPIPPATSCPESPVVGIGVLIQEMEETAAKPNDDARWGESRVALTLAEV
jgi:hypothetical protein